MATTNKVDRTEAEAENLDPLSGEPGAHPVGAGLGAAAAGAATGAAGGAVAGPVGAVIGAVLGGIAGGLAGKGIAESIDPTVEADYWRHNHATRPYADAGSTTDFDAYEPAYRYGWESRSAHEGKTFDEVESDLSRGWSQAKGTSRLDWIKAKLATRDAWDRIK